MIGVCCSHDFAGLRLPGTAYRTLGKFRQTPRRKKGAEIWNLDSLVMQGATHLMWRPPLERLGRFFLLLVKEVAATNQSRQEQDQQDRTVRDDRQQDCHR